jgi:ribosomal protein S18 acetylase RimI-like enzyme
MIQYSIANVDDLDSVVKLFLEVYSGILKKRLCKLPGKDFVKDIMHIYLDSAGKGFIVAKENGKVIGFVCGVKHVYDLWKKALHPKRILKFLFTPRQIFIMPPKFGHFFHAHILLMGVSRKYQHKGVALKLAGKVFGFFKKNKIKKAYFQIPHSLVKTYVKHGCEVIKERKEWVIMQKVL